MWLKLVNNSNGEARVVEAPGCEVLIGSGAECDVVIDGLNRQSARVIRAGHHIFMTSSRNEKGDVEPIYRDTISEYGTNYHWGGNESRVDQRPFDLGNYTVSVTSPPVSKVRHLTNTLRWRIGQISEQLGFR